MSSRVLLTAFLLMLALGCATNSRTLVVVDRCPLPSGYQLESAIITAKQTLMNCPEKLDRVFMALVEIAKHSPSVDNSLLIQDLLKDLVDENTVSEIYAKTLYQKYFSHKFVSLPNIKTCYLTAEVDAIKLALKKELIKKRVGLIECSGDRETYASAEAEYIRITNFIENLAYNEQYLKETR